MLYLGLLGVSSAVVGAADAVGVEKEYRFNFSATWPITLGRGRHRRKTFEKDTPRKLNVPGN